MNQLPGCNVSVCSLQLSPVLSSILMVSFLALARLTLKSRFGIWRSAPMWPTSPATLVLSPPLLSLRMDTIWPQVTTHTSIFSEKFQEDLQVHSSKITANWSVFSLCSGTELSCDLFWLFPSGAQDSSLKLWDLRKLKNFKTINLDNNYEVRPEG